MPEVTYVSTVLGRADICVEVLSTDNNALWAILNERVGRLPGVRRMDTTTVLKVHKLRYQNPTSL